MKADATRVEMFLTDRSMIDLVRQVGKTDELGTLSSDQRQQEVAIRARRIMADAIDQALSELSLFPQGYNLGSEEDRADFLQGMQAGIVLAAVDVGGITENAEFFDAVSRLDFAGKLSAL